MNCVMNGELNGTKGKLTHLPSSINKKFDEIIHSLHQ